MLKLTQQQQLDFYHRSEQLSEVGHWYLDLTTDSLHWSDNIYKIHGLDPKSYTPEVSTAISYYHPQDQDRVKQFITEAIKKGTPFQFELRLVTAHDEIRYVRSNAECELNENGKVIGVFGIFQDVTEQVISKQLINLAEKAHQTHIDASGDGYWDWHIQDDYEYMSPRFWQIFGYEPHEKPHKPSAWQGIIFEEDLQTALKNFALHIESKGEYPYEQEVRYRHKNGSTVYVLCRGKVIEWDEQGRALRMVGTHTDITQQKLNQEKLYHTLDFQSLLTNASTDYIFVKDDHFNIVQANDAFLNLYPKEVRNSVIGSTTFEKYPAEQVAEFLAEDRKAFETGYSEVFENIDFPDGTKRTLHTKKIRFEDKQHKPFILGLARDVTEIKQVEQNLLNANSELEEFAYRTSHDLRAPLISTNQLLGIIKDQLKQGQSDNTIEYIEIAQQSLGKLESLVSDILRLAKIGDDALEKTSVNLTDLVNDTCNKLGHMEGFDSISIELIKDDNNPINAIKEHLILVVENLISNAVKYQDPEQKNSFLHISKYSTDNAHIISFKDNGLGIPSQSRDKVFTMFSRFHAKCSYGSGLGLYMVQKVTHKMGGEISCLHLKKGTEFIIKIPK